MSDRSTPPEEREKDDACAGADDLHLQFVSGVSDDLRTPLVAILGFADLLLEDEPSPRRREALEAIRRHGEQLLARVDDLLDLQHLASGELEVLPVEADLRVAVDTALARVRSRLEAQASTFAVEIDPSVPERARFDPTRVRQVIGHMLENALRFASRGALGVRVGYSPPATAWVEVEDAGPELTLDELERLTLPRAAGPDVQARSTAGLELVVARSIATSLAGQLDHRRAASGGNILRFQFRAEPAGRGAPARRTRSALRGRVLVVDDSPDIAKLVRQILQRIGLEVELAENGRTGVTRALRSRFDLILMDLQMPVLDGFSAMRELRAAGLETPIIALTANSAPDFRELSLAAGANSFLAKPIDRLALLEEISRYLPGPPRAGASLGATRRAP
jgi:CheY-like chemotaxis protein